MLQLDSAEAIDRFLDTSQDVKETTGFLNKSKNSQKVAALGDFYDKLKYKTRVLVFTIDKSEFEEEIKSVKLAARFLS